MKLLLCCVVVAMLGIAKESSAFETNEVYPNLHNHQDGQYRQHMDYYDNFYNEHYNNNRWGNYYTTALQMPIVNWDNNFNVDWVCTNSKTKKQWAIGTKTINKNDRIYSPREGGPNGPPLSLLPPNFPPQHEGYQHYKVPPNYPPSGHHCPQSNLHPQQNPQPTFPTDKPNDPQKPPHTIQNHNGNPQMPSTTPNPQTTTINTSGVGIIDIRVGEGNK